ncbi:MAG: hypothetical protein A4E65_00080 [Syntrophorhabdus sp. PtaU1.Bin153]|nr:MAG: hypothetical protein A4E65_00080 [Syntrophorhabdus sp. PtaU1.Bin153]
MSDGPHRSLPMRRGWKRVAECADNQVFEREEVGDAIIRALEKDWKEEVSPEFMSNLWRVCSDQEGCLFKDDVRPRLEALRGTAGCGIGRIVLDLAIERCPSGTAGLDFRLKTITDALTDRMARCARQVEEHYCRKSTEPHANRVRERIEQATDRAAMEGLARRILKPEPARLDHPPLKREGLDDGVRL